MRERDGNGNKVNRQRKQVFVRFYRMSPRKVAVTLLNTHDHAPQAKKRRTRQHHGAVIQQGREAVEVLLPYVIRAANGT